MKINDIVKAWRDPVFRATQSEVPANPAGMIELTGTALDAVAGGNRRSSSHRRSSSRRRSSSSRRSRSDRRRSSRCHGPV